MKLDIYTDGGCRPTNPGPGAWGYVVLEGDNKVIESSGFSNDTTNNKMELQAVIEALNYLYNMMYVDRGSFTVYSDSAYVVKGMNEWMEGWKKKDWVKVKNVKQWKQLDDLQSLFHYNIKFVHVRAHNGNKWNEYVDELCTETILEKQ